MAKKRKNLRIVVDGRVQGVGYRAYAIDTARRLRLDGWVRNRVDGTVEMLISGPEADVESFVGLCTRGPAYARVDTIDLTDAEAPAEPGFRRLPTA